MYQIREILRLHYEHGWADRAIARAHSVSHVTVGDLVRRFEQTGIGWPMPEDLADSVLQRKLYTSPEGRPQARPEPNWAEVHQELGRKGVTLQLLWSEYLKVHPTGFQYAQFCAKYREFRKRTDWVLRKVYTPGEHCFVDYAGPTLTVIDPLTGELQAGQLFVAVLGFSRYTFADVHPQQTTGWWIRGHMAAFQYFGGVPRVVVPDNPKALVTKAERVDVTLNRTYLAFARHYGVAIIPARVRKPRDKGAVEAGVQLVERWIMAVLRHERLMGWDAARDRVATLLEALNAHPFQKLEGSRQSLWIQERAALAPLPATPFEDEAWRVAIVHRDYHVEVDRRYYSVPYALVGQSVEIRITTTTIECFHDHIRVASHPRQTRTTYHTIPEHMPPAHRAMTEHWNASYFHRQAEQVGPHTTALIDRWLRQAVIPEQAYRRCQGILGLVPRHSPAIVEQAAGRANETGIQSYRAVKAFCLAASQADSPSSASRSNHENVRGAQYYAEPDSETVTEDQDRG